MLRMTRSAPAQARANATSKVMRAQVKQIAAARDGGRERMLAAVLRTLGGCSEDNASNASRVIAARGHLPSFQLLNSRLPTIRREAAFCVASLFQVSSLKSALLCLT